MPAKRIPKEAPAPVEVKRKPGRPRKMAEAVPVVAETKKKPGRPRKVEAAPAKPAKNGRPRKAAKGLPKPGSKTEKIYKLLTRPKGCTRSEVLDAIGWPSISMQHSAQIMGLKLKVEKPEGGPTRYYGNP